ncbi:MAG: hypothetical protein QW734_03915 [Candidatus Bathyarchaeia archaeon]
MSEFFVLEIEGKQELTRLSRQIVDLVSNEGRSGILYSRMVQVLLCITGAERLNFIVPVARNTKADARIYHLPILGIKGHVTSSIGPFSVVCLQSPMPIDEHGLRKLVAYLAKLHKCLNADAKHPVVVVVVAIEELTLSMSGGSGITVAGRSR